MCFVASAAVATSGTAAAATDESIESLTAKLHGSDKFPRMDGKAFFGYDPADSLLMWLDVGDVKYFSNRTFVAWFERGDGRGFYAGTTDLLSGASAPIYVAGPARAERHNLRKAERIVVTVVANEDAAALERRSRESGWIRAFDVVGQKVTGGHIRSKAQRRSLGMRISALDEKRRCLSRPIHTLARSLDLHGFQSGF